MWNPDSGYGKTVEKLWGTYFQQGHRVPIFHVDFHEDFGQEIFLK
jgi:hypothetical protein